MREWYVISARVRNPRALLAHRRWRITLRSSAIRAARKKYPCPIPFDPFRTYILSSEIIAGVKADRPLSDQQRLALEVLTEATLSLHRAPPRRESRRQLPDVLPQFHHWQEPPRSLRLSDSRMRGNSTSSSSWRGGRSGQSGILYREQWRQPCTGAALWLYGGSPQPRWRFRE
jgi:hypothetical protein